MKIVNSHKLMFNLLLLVCVFIAFTGLLGAWFGSQLIGRFSAYSMMNIWAPTIIFLFFWLFLAFLSFLKQALAGVLVLLASPFYLAKAFLEVCNITNWHFGIFFMVPQSLAIFESLAFVISFWLLSFFLIDFFHHCGNKPA